MRKGRWGWRPEVRGWSPPVAPTPRLFETLMGGFWTHQRCCLDQRWRRPRPLPGSVECGITHFSTSSEAKASVNSGSFSTSQLQRPSLPHPPDLLPASPSGWIQQKTGQQGAGKQIFQNPRAGRRRTNVRLHRAGEQPARWKVGVWRRSPHHWLWEWNENVSHSVVFNSLWPHGL